jgi:nitrogen fixation/metabolism regulation signal transduction histidine kinase
VHEQSIVVDGNVAGRLVVTASTTLVWRALQIELGIIAVAALLSYLIALAFSRAVRRMIVRPVREVADTADRIAQSGDYALRIAGERKDEIGTLIKRFNEMLAQIQSRDESLARSRDELGKLCASERIGDGDVDHVRERV